MAKKRFATLFAFPVNHKSRIKVKPINSVPKNAASKRVIWNVYGFK
jgi:hypothetical protein